jgi:hypothetical protein
MLTSEVADNLFSRIDATNAPDSTFLSTMRVLLHKRLPQNETVRLTCKAKNYTAQDISNASVAACMGNFMPELVQQSSAPGHNIYIIYALQVGTGEKMLDMVKANIGVGKRYMSNFTRRDDLQVFYARKANALFYTDDTERNTVIFAEKMELKHFHALQMMIPKYLPTLFAESPLTEAEIKLLKCTGGKSSDEYERLIEGFARELDIRSEIIRTKLAGFTTGFERTRVDELRNEISIHQNEYDLYLSKMREVSQKIDERK